MRSHHYPECLPVGTTSFGNYEFLAESPGLEPFTGILPLKFNGGHVALDILFFAPAMFVNLREAEVARGRKFFKIQ